MQALEFVGALREIVSELKVVELASLMRPWVSNPPPVVTFDDALKDRFARLLFDSHAGYQHLMRKDSTRRILEQMNIGHLYDPVRLRSMLSSIALVQQLIHLLQQPAVFAAVSTFSAQLEALTSVQATTENLLEREKIGLVNPDEAIVQLELVEYSDEEGFSPKRIEVLSESITKLHISLAVLYSSVSDKITFKYFDSGSGLLVGIQCAKEIAATIGTLFSQWWEKIVFFRYDTFDKKLAAANKSLTFAANVEASIASNAITREDGDNLKHRVFQEMEKLTGIGVTVPITAAATVDQRQLLTEVRNTKLLTAGNSEAGTDS